MSSLTYRFFHPIYIYKKILHKLFKTMKYIYKNSTENCKKKTRTINSEGQKYRISPCSLCLVYQAHKAPLDHFNPLWLSSWICDSDCLWKFCATNQLSDTALLFNLQIQWQQRPRANSQRNNKMANSEYSVFNPPKNVFLDISWETQL